MRILYITKFYAPEPGAASVRVSDFTRRWSSAGENVTVVTCFPNYMIARESESRRNGFPWRHETVDGVNVQHVATLFPSARRILTRIIHQFFFCVMAFLAGLFARPKPDVLIVSSPPFPLGLCGYLLSRLRRVPLIFEVRDLFPGSAEAFGVVKNKLLLSMLSSVERLFYRKAARVVAVTQGLYDEVRSHVSMNGQVVKVINGTDTELFRPGQGSKENWEPAGLRDSFVVIYTGLMGRAHGALALVEAARLLADRKDISFVFMGDGVDKPAMQEMKREHNLDNVSFIDTQPVDRVPKYVCASDVGFASLLPSEFTTKSIPVKMFDYMACAKPVILCGRGEAAEIVKEHNAGICADPEDPDAIAAAVLRLYEDSDACRRHGENGRNCVEVSYNRAKIAGDYLAMLRQLGASADQARNRKDGKST